MAHASDNSKHTSPRRALNVRALIIVLGVLAMFHFGVRHLHGRQVGATCDYLKQTGMAALDAGDHERAFEFLDQYLALRGGDADVQRLVSELLQEHTTDESLQRAFRMNEQMLLARRDDDDLRLRQVRTAVRLDRFSDAAAHLQELRSRTPDVSEVWYYSGLVAESLEDLDTAAAHFERAIGLPNPAPECFEHLANVVSSNAGGRMPDPNRAEALLNQMVATCDSAKSRFIRASWLMQQQRPEHASVDLWQALKSRPGDISFNTMLLQAYRQMSAESSSARFESARLLQHFQQQVVAQPESTALRLLLASAQWLADQNDAAIATLEDGIRRSPREYRLHELLVDFLVSRHQTERARRVYAGLPERALSRARRQFLLGRVLMAEQQWDAAAEAFGLAISLAGQNDDVRSRASTCLALCQQHSGNSVAARESYRLLLRSNPQSVSGRLGMATAFLQQDQPARAIIEYRRLMDVPGVPAFLANLLIESNLSQPAGRRDWSEVEQLLSDTSPAVQDDVQRALLQTDLLFAKGAPSRALDHLERAVHQHPGDAKLAQAWDSVLLVKAPALQRQIEMTVQNDAADESAQGGLLALLMARREPQAVTIWLNQLRSPSAGRQLSEGKRLKIVAEVTSGLARSAGRNGRGQYTAELLAVAENAYQQLVTRDTNQLPAYVGFLAEQQSARRAAQVLQQSPVSANANIRAFSWLECLRRGQDRAAVRSVAQQDLLRLINNDPASVVLRMAYAESQILFEDYESAGAVLEQLIQHDRRNAAAFSRAAWILAVSRRDLSKALEYSSTASRIAPSDPQIRDVQGLVLALTGDPQTALQIFSSIPRDERLLTSWLYEAKALQAAGQSQAARQLAHELTELGAEHQITPADAKLLHSLKNGGT